MIFYAQKCVHFFLVRLFHGSDPLGDAAVQQILSETTDPDGPSLLARLCWCQCAPIPRLRRCGGGSPTEALF